MPEAKSSQQIQEMLPTTALATEHRYEEPLDPWTERARRSRPQWTDEQQGALARVARGTRRTTRQPW